MKEVFVILLVDQGYYNKDIAEPFKSLKFSFGYRHNATQYDTYGQASDALHALPMDGMFQIEKFFVKDDSSKDKTRNPS